MTHRFDPQAPTGDLIQLHRHDRDRGSVDFNIHLVDGELLAGAEVTFWRKRPTGPDQEVTDAFGDPAPQVSNGFVIFRIRFPTSGPPATAGVYTVRVTAHTDTDRTLNSTHPLELRGAGS